MACVRHGRTCGYPDGLAARARELGLNVSALTQSVRAEVVRHATDDWLESLGAPARHADHTSAMTALDDAPDEFGVDER